MRGRILLLLLDQLGCQPPQEVSGGLSIAFQGKAGWHAPGARPGSVPWGSSPPCQLPSCHLQDTPGSGSLAQGQVTQP